MENNEKNEGLTSVSLTTGEQQQTNLYLPTEVQNYDDMLNNLENMTPAAILTPEILNFDSVGDKIRGIFKGFNYLQMPNDKTGELENKLAVFFNAKVDGKIKLYCHLGKQFVASFQHISQGTPFEVELSEIKKLQGGRTFKKYLITALI